MDLSIQGVVGYLNTFAADRDREKAAWQLERSTMLGRVSELTEANERLQKSEQLLLRRIAMLEEALKRERSSKPCLAIGFGRLTV
jgi:hypothetical protein